MTEKVEMRPAYQWTCDGCGRDNFESSIVIELTEDDRLDQARHMGLIGEFDTVVPDYLEGRFESYPESVTCKFCSKTYDTTHMNSAPGSEEE